METTGEVNNGLVTEQMDCPQSKVGSVIGARGIIVQEIMRRSGCKIVVNQDGFAEGVPRKVVITGLSHQLPLAKQLVSAVIAEGPSAIQTIGGDGSDASALQISEMDCPPDKVGIVIGSRGVIIQDIMRRSGCKIVVNQQVPPGNPCIVQITGKAFQIVEAKRLINSVIQNGPLALSDAPGGGGAGMDLDMTTEEMDCPPEKVGIVIGAKGVIINEIMRKSGTKIVINQEVPAGQPNVVIITGPRYRIATAKGLVNSVITGGPNALNMGGGAPGRPTVHEFPIVQAQVGRLIGPGGSTIKEIQQNCNVKINIEVLQDTDQRIVRVSGDPESVMSAVQVVWQLLQHGPQAALSMIRGGGAPGGRGGGAWTGDSRMAPPHMQGSWGHGQPAPQVWGRGQAPGGAGVYQMPPTAVAPQVPAVGVQYLGADGKAGQLQPPTMMPNGQYLQIAYINHAYFESLSGGQTGPNISLIKQKSGARVSIDGRLEQDGIYVKVELMGNLPDVNLAAQMIQEVLVYGTARLEVMEDAKISGPAMDGGAYGVGPARGMF